jgi:hypothetical protein
MDASLQPQTSRAEASTNDSADALGLGSCTNQHDGSWLQLAAGGPWYRGKTKGETCSH